MAKENKTTFAEVFDRHMSDILLTIVIITVVFVNC